VGWFDGNRSFCGSHLLYVVLFWSDHWHRYVLNFLVIIYLSFVTFDLWFSIICIENLNELFCMLEVDWVVRVVGVVVVVADA
jgi:hypothetical protein